MKGQKKNSQKLEVGKEREAKANAVIKLVKNFPPSKQTEDHNVREYEWRAYN